MFINLNQKLLTKVNLILVFSALSWGMFSISAQAQTQLFSTLNSDGLANQTPELNLSLSPPVTYLSILPGETKSFQLNLQNSGSRNLLVQLQLADFESDNLTGQPILKLGSKFGYLKPRISSWNWQTPQLLKSGNTAKIWLDLTVPTNAKLAEYHLTILAQAAATSSEVSHNSTEAVGSSGSVTGLIGSNLIVAIAKNDIDLSQLALADWQFPKFVDSLGKISLKGLVKNSGEQAGPIIGRASLTGPNGQLLKSWLVYPDMVLPNSTRGVRVIDTTQDPSAEPDTWLGQPEVVLSDKLEYKPNWLFGSYIFKIQLFHQNYTDATASSEKIVQITALPYGILTILVAIPICFWLIALAKIWFDKLISANIPTN